MKRKICGFGFGILIFFSGILNCQNQDATLSPERHDIAVVEQLKLDFPVPFKTSLNKQNYEMKLKVVPGGQSIGVLIESQGVIVAGHSAVLAEGGKKVNPASGAGLKAGDVILSINGETVHSESQFRELVAKAGVAGSSVMLEVRRDDEIFFTRITPVFCRETLRYRLGLLIRDGAAGIGTLTFYDPKSMIFGALGHVVTDTNNGAARPVQLLGGKIVGASVHGIYRGKRGQPGEKIGVFQGENCLNGTIKENTRLGIFGTLQKPLENQVYNMPIPVAAAEEIHEGQAEVLTVLKGEKVERFSIEVVKVNIKGREDGKGLVIKITDRRLLDQAGGIVQGMSGSPIIQDNKLVGAVTHVFVNDPLKGYGVPVEWMLCESEIMKKAINNINTHKAAS